MKPSHSHENAYISQTYVQLLVAYIEHDHPEPERMMTTLGLTGIDHLKATTSAGKLGRIALADFTQMLKCTQQEMQRLGRDAENLAIDMARLISPAHYGVLGYLILACANMGEALTLLNRYARLLDDHYSMTTTIGPETVILTWDVTVRDDPLYFEMGLASMVQFMINLSGVEAPLIAVNLTTPAPVHHEVIEDFYACPVAYQQPLMTLEFPTLLLLTPIKQADKTLLDLLSAQADQALAQLPQGREWEQKVRQEIVRLCHEDVPTLDKVASNLCITPRTLQRHLAAEGLRFQPLLDETRRHLAEQYLQEGRLQLTDIAELLGYSDQSALTRAFKRWTGNTPHVVRKGG